MSFQYLEPKEHYEDRYDVGTIRECLKQLEIIEEVGQKMKLEPTFQKYPESEQERNTGLFRDRMLFWIQAHRYKHRASTIAEWFEADRIKQDKQDNTPTSKTNCPECDSAMTDDSSHHLVDWDYHKPMRVLFTFNCPKCKKRQGVYDDGEMHVSKSDFCPECKQKLEVKEEVLAEIPPKVEYSLSSVGTELQSVIKELEKWGRQHVKVD